jgi:excisionase family DNA binding protein
MDGKADNLWRISEAAAYLQLPVSAVYKMTCPKAKLRIPHIRIAGRLRFRKSDLDFWLNQLLISSADMLARANARMMKHGIHP